MGVRPEDRREEWYDPASRVAVTIVDVPGAAQTLAHGHLAGPTSAQILAKGVAAVALLGAETSAPDEVVSLQMKCTGPIGGLCVECSGEGKLRGYTEKKLLEDFDGLGPADWRKVLGDCQLQVTRSVPGKILSQGLAGSLDEYFAGSLQRRAVLRVEASVTDEIEVLLARGVLVEILPDAPAASDGVLSRFADLKSLAVAPRNLLGKLGLKTAELKKTDPLAFGCRCSHDRAVAMLSALSPAERANLPPTIDITCHMCGRLYTVPTGAASLKTV